MFIDELGEVEGQKAIAEIKANKYLKNLLSPESTRLAGKHEFAIIHPTGNIKIDAGLDELYKMFVVENYRDLNQLVMNAGIVFGGPVAISALNKTALGTPLKQIIPKIKASMIAKTKGMTNANALRKTITNMPAEDISANVMRQYEQLAETKPIAEKIATKAEEKPILEPTAQEQPIPQQSATSDLYEQAKQLVIDNQIVSTAMLQRQLGINYKQATDYVNAMEVEGLVTPANNKGLRKLIVKPKEQPQQTVDQTIPQEPPLEQAMQTPEQPPVETPPEVKATTQAKQAWEMTKEEYGQQQPYSRELQLPENEDKQIRELIAKKYKKEFDKYPLDVADFGLKSQNNIKEHSELFLKLYIKESHRLEIEKAISEGKPVPSEVLADYPDLKPKATEQAIPATEKPNVVEEGQILTEKNNAILDIKRDYDHNFMFDETADYAIPAKEMIDQWKAEGKLIDKGDGYYSYLYREYNPENAITIPLNKDIDIPDQMFPTKVKYKITPVKEKMPIGEGEDIAGYDITETTTISGKPITKVDHVPVSHIEIAEDSFKIDPQSIDTLEHIGNIKAENKATTAQATMEFTKQPSVDTEAFAKMTQEERNALAKSKRNEDIPVGQSLLVKKVPKPQIDLLANTNANNPIFKRYEMEINPTKKWLKEQQGKDTRRAVKFTTALKTLITAEPFMELRVESNRYGGSLNRVRNLFRTDVIAAPRKTRSKAKNVIGSIYMDLTPDEVNAFWKIVAPKTHIENYNVFYADSIKEGKTIAEAKTFAEGKVPEGITIDEHIKYLNDATAELAQTPSGQRVFDAIERYRIVMKDTLADAIKRGDLEDVRWVDWYFRRQVAKYWDPNLNPNLPKRMGKQYREYFSERKGGSQEVIINESVLEQYLSSVYMDNAIDDASKKAVEMTTI